MSRLVRKLSAVVLLCAATFAAWAAAPPQAPPPDSLQAIAERTLIRELMDRYGIVHDSGTPEQYADLFTADGEIATGTGAAIVKGRQALMEQARRDHERYSETGPDGKTTSIMRHLISNAEITLTGADTATGTCYVTTMVKKGAVGPAVLSISRYVDRYVKAGGKWRIQRREIYLEFGNAELGREMGFGGR